jgi:segregation and condensation protein B
MSEEVHPGATSGPPAGAADAPSRSDGVPVGSAEAPAESAESPVDSGEPVFEAAASEAALEALLFVAERPLARSEIARLLGCDRETVDALVGDLETTLAARGVRLVSAGDHVALATAPETGPVIARYVGVEPGRLSPASLEVLAIVAYRQPVTKAVVERIRGVDSDYTLRSLLHRRLVVETARADAPGRPILYGTGIDFLERFGLASLEDLPPLDAPVAGRLVDVGAAAADGAGTAGRDAATSDAAPGSDRDPRADA